ncbi:MAG: tellurite resistance TerB family protein [Vicinamibacterales bacterium]
MPKAGVKQSRPGRGQAPASLALDQALIALFIAAMNANGHVTPAEAERAHHLIWSTRRFRRKSGDTVGKLIQDVRRLVEERGAGAVIDSSARVIPARVRPSTFAVLADLLLSDGKIDPQERRFLKKLASRLELDAETARQVLDVVRLKNQL